jgi:hypothetical protein
MTQVIDLIELNKLILFLLDDKKKQRYKMNYFFLKKNVMLTLRIYFFKKR